MASRNYTTVEGDRIDLLADKFYKSSKGIKLIVDANPKVPIERVFPLGTRLVIPIVEQEEAKKDKRPPWKQ